MIELRYWLYCMCYGGDACVLAFGFERDLQCSLYRVVEGRILACWDGVLVSHISSFGSHHLG